MQVNVAQLLKSSFGAERIFIVDEDIDIEKQAVRVAGQARLIRTNRGILVMGNFKAGLEIECSRCLEKYRCPVEVIFEEEFFPSIDILTRVSVKAPEDQQPGYFTIDSNHIIDLTDAIRQYALLTVPMKPLCKEDCAGLCPVCGKNRNSDICKCVVEEIDPRLEVLKKLSKIDD